MVMKELELDDSEDHGDWDGNEASPNDEAVAEGKRANRPLDFFGSQAQGLENRGDAVAEVGAEERHGDDVKKNHQRILESHDDHAEWVRRAKSGKVGIDADGEVEDVENHECEDRQP